MATQSLTAVGIQVNGLVNASFIRAVRTTNQGLIGIQRQAHRTNMSLRGLGTGLVGGFLGAGLWSALTKFISSTTQMTKDQDNAATLLQTTLANNLRLHHQNMQLAVGETAELQKQAEHLQDITGQYAGIFIKGSAILSTSKLSFDQIKQMQPFIAQMVVAQRELGAKGASMAEVYQAVSKGIVGMGRNLMSMGLKLSTFQRRMLVRNSLLGPEGIAANIRIIEDAINNLYMGASTRYLRTLEGQLDAAASAMQRWGYRINEAWFPLQQQFFLIGSEIAKFAAPYIVASLHILTKWAIEFNKYLKEQLPTIKKLVAEGWLVLLKAIKWFQDNKSWLVPALVAYAKLFIAWQASILLVKTALFLLSPVIGIVTGAMALLDAAMAANPFAIAILGAAAFAAGLYIVLQHTKEIQDAMERLVEFIAGSKVFTASRAPHALPARSKLGIHGHVERAIPLEPGLMGYMNNWMNDFFGGGMGKDRKQGFLPQRIAELQASIQGFFTWLGPASSEAGLNMANQLVASAKKAGLDIVSNLQQSWLGGYIEIFNNLNEAMVNLSKTITRLLIDPLTEMERGVLFMIENIKTLNSWSLNILDPFGFLGGAGATRKAGAGSGGGGSGGGHGGAFPYGPTISTAGPMNALAYGPGSEGATRADMNQIWGATVKGHKIRLGPESAAISPSLLGQFPIGSWVDEIDENTGKVIRHKRIDDTSWYGPHRPTRNTIENYNDVSLGHVKVIRSPNQGPDTTGNPGASRHTVHIHNNVVYNVTEGELGHRIAEHHRNHMEKLKRDMEELEWRRDRGSFTDRRTRMA